MSAIENTAARRLKTWATTKYSVMRRPSKNITMTARAEKRLDPNARKEIATGASAGYAVDMYAPEVKVFGSMRILNMPSREALMAIWMSIPSSYPVGGLSARR
jgi:hypothetical protein